MKKNELKKKIRLVLDDVLDFLAKEERRPNKMKECCFLFFITEGLQHILNVPMKYCPYCGYKLAKKELQRFNKNEKEREKMFKEWKVDKKFWTPLRKRKRILYVNSSWDEEG